MRTIIATFILLFAAWPTASAAPIIDYAFTITTAYASGDPFANRLDHAFTSAGTGYFQIANTGDSTFTGVVGTIAVSVFAGDLSFTSDPIVLAPGNAVSVAIPNDARQVGGFNGPAYFFRSGVQITLNGTLSAGALSQTVSLLVADADIHSGVPRTDGFGLTSDSFVLQGGDPWGFDPGADFAIGQTNGVYTLTQPVSEPGSLVMLSTCLPLWAVRQVLFRQRRFGRKHTPNASRAIGS